MIKTSVVSVTTTPVQLTTLADYGDGSISIHPASLITIAESAAALTGGGATGYPVVAASDFALDLVQGEQVWAVSPSGTVVVNVLQTGL